MNTPLALARLHEMVGALNKAGDDAVRVNLAANLRAGGALLGLIQGDAETWFRGVNQSDAAEIEAQIAARSAARVARDFAAADQIRDALKAAGIELQDSVAGTTWRRVG